LSTRLNGADALEIFQKVAGIIKSAQDLSNGEAKSWIDVLIALEAALIDRLSKNSQLEVATLAFDTVVSSDSLAVIDSFGKILRYASQKITAADASKFIEKCTNAIVENAPNTSNPMIDLLVFNREPNKKADVIKGPLKAFAMLAPSIGSNEIEPLSQPIVDLMGRTTDPYLLADLTAPFAVLLPKLKPEKVKDITDSVLRVIKYAADGWALMGMSSAYDALSSDERQSVARALAAPIIAEIANSKYRDHREMFSMVATKLAPDLGPVEAATLAKEVISIVNGMSTTDDVSRIADNFWPVVDRMTPETQEILLKAIYEAHKTQENRLSDALVQSADAPVFLLQSAAAFQVCNSSIKILLEEGFIDRPRIVVRITESLRKVQVDDVRTLTNTVMQSIAEKQFGESRTEAFDMLALLLPKLPANEVASRMHILIGEVLKNVNTTRSLRLVEPFATLNAPMAREDALVLAKTVADEMKSKKTLDDNVVSGFVSIVAQLPQAVQLEILVSILKNPNVYGSVQRTVIDAIAILRAGQNSTSASDIWPLIDWLRNQPGIDVVSPPQRGATNLMQS
jgi:hypothetical protein